MSRPFPTNILLGHTLTHLTTQNVSPVLDFVTQLLHILIFFHNDGLLGHMLFAVRVGTSSARVQKAASVTCRFSALDAIVMSAAHQLLCMFHAGAFEVQGYGASRTANEFASITTKLTKILHFKRLGILLFLCWHSGGLSIRAREFPLKYGSFARLQIIIVGCQHRHRLGTVSRSQPIQHLDTALAYTLPGRSNSVHAFLLFLLVLFTNLPKVYTTKLGSSCEFLGGVKFLGTFYCIPLEIALGIVFRAAAVRDYFNIFVGRQNVAFGLILSKDSIAAELECGHETFRILLHFPGLGHGFCTIARHHAIQIQLLLGSFHHSLFDRTLGHEAINVNRLFLPNAMYPRHGLNVGLGIPITVK
mmetsp:Transcript_3338/g.6912  ORF Transcript_3338/g.6912 Transcript_3338/m.6912 type:complete len:360 (-) Transcript_3338:1934-3013(-)